MNSKIPLRKMQLAFAAFCAVMCTLATVAFVSVNAGNAGSRWTLAIVLLQGVTGLLIVGLTGWMTVRELNARSRAEAALLYREERTLLLLDMGLPDGQGLDTVCRARAAAPAVPLIVLTGLDDEDLAAQAMKEGAQDYLIKGEIENRALPRALRHCIERHRMQLATDLIHAEVRARTEELKEANAQLRAEIQGRDAAERDLRSNNLQLWRSNRDLEDFAYVASHDLKTPLTGINSAAEWLEEDLRGSLSDESRKILSLMRNRINRMEKLLDDLLSYSRAGRTDTALAQTNLAQVFESILEVLVPPAHITVRVAGELPVIVTASAQLEQVLRNLINNAIKHHDKPRGEVVLSARRVGSWVEFLVRDDGPGILPEYHEKIFQLFQTLKRRDEVEGSGMGLAVVKKLVEQQNSRITVHSGGDGTGSEFRFRWPAETTDHDPSAEQNA